MTRSIARRRAWQLRIAFAALAMFVLSCIFSAAFAQTKPRFDVASVKLDRTGAGGAGDDFPVNGTWKWTRIDLSFLIMYAYDVSLRQIANIPGAFRERDANFEVVAKMAADVADADFRLMLQSLLEERFQFRMHREMREMPVNTIEIAKGGHRLQRASGDCVKAQKSTLLSPDQHRCGEITLRYQLSDGTSHQIYAGRSVSLHDLATALSRNGPVFDVTQIQGLWDIDVDIELHIQPSTDDPAESASRTFDYHRRFNSAFEKQLGLTVKPGKFTKRLVPFIVVDHVAWPSPN
jgi:uncharacterized protein (TIGR03435 family)